MLIRRVHFSLPENSERQRNQNGKSAYITISYRQIARKKQLNYKKSGKNITRQEILYDNLIIHSKTCKSD